MLQAAVQCSAKLPMLGPRKQVLGCLCSGRRKGSSCWEFRSEDFTLPGSLSPVWHKSEKANDLEEFFNHLKAQKGHSWSPKGSCDTNNSVFPSRGQVQTSLYEEGHMRTNGCVAFPNTTTTHRTYPALGCVKHLLCEHIYPVNSSLG